MIENVTAAAPVPAMNSLRVNDLFFMVEYECNGLYLDDCQLLNIPEVNFYVHAIYNLFPVRSSDISTSFTCF
jgi:hypothetical protein